ncbi:hydrogenase expression protein [Halorubrum sp. JWXQ-INN 858]|uniref:AIR synthase-related protein n=1 Tax=Halorubrum sp. JWXQ-INN 858 TaxID=2690782 RepID=UPI00135C1D93|nr:AIR synthase-related protein [Halorubrum sp. JWXQ-INN 858]MWV64167.1 hydrogenase expression protein [Halorubrum sp. JWXQ-INN 858]
MGNGKIGRRFFAERIRPNLGADRADVTLGPAHGCDFAVIEPGRTADDAPGASGGGAGADTAASATTAAGSAPAHAIVLATDPISVLPELGYDRAGRFALHIVLSDVAVSGIAPSHLSIAFSLPTTVSDAAFGELWDAISDECARLGVAVTTGHTARYPGATLPWVGAATALGVGDPDRIVRPDGARPGDRLVVTRGPAVEATGLFASLFPDALDLPAETVATAQERLDDVRLVGDALAAREAGAVHAMHDATEGGLLGAFHETAGAAGVRFEIERDAVPVAPGVEPVCRALGMDPWNATTAGTLIASVAAADADAVVEALRGRGTPAAVVGDVTAGSGVAVDGVDTEPPDGDASWPVYAALSEASAADDR